STTGFMTLLLDDIDHHSQDVLASATTHKKRSSKKSHIDLVRGFKLPISLVAALLVARPKSPARQRTRPETGRNCDSSPRTTGRAAVRFPARISGKCLPPNSLRQRIPCGVAPG